MRSEPPVAMLACHYHDCDRHPTADRLPALRRRFAALAPLRRLGRQRLPCGDLWARAHRAGADHREAPRRPSLRRRGPDAPGRLRGPAETGPSQSHAWVESTRRRPAGSPTIRRTTVRWTSATSSWVTAVTTTTSRPTRGFTAASPRRR